MGQIPEQGSNEQPHSQAGKDKGPGFTNVAINGGGQGHRSGDQGIAANVGTDQNE